MEIICALGEGDVKWGIEAGGMWVKWVKWFSYDLFFYCLVFLSASVRLFLQGGFLKFSTF